MLPGTPERATHDYKRAGTSSLYAALDITSGQVIGSLHARHRAIEFKKFLQTLDREVPADLDVHLILDNASTHKTPAIQKWLVGHPRFVLHFTPTSSSWLNLVERWFAELTNKKLRRRTPLRPRTEHRHPQLDRHLERGPQTIRLDQDRRRNPRINPPLLHTNQRITTLVPRLRGRDNPPSPPPYSGRRMWQAKCVDCGSPLQSGRDR
jgi:transposase